MEYLALIYADEGAWERLSEARRASAYELYVEFARAPRMPASSSPATSSGRPRRLRPSASATAASS